ncbi:MAG: 16S rRNA (adenine(1518)-N(6)/adenine(1519)-N(6))-dimethyltransferase RsmA [Gemmatimonadaceae bacterium]
MPRARARSGSANGGGRNSPRHPPVLKKYGQHFLSDRGILEGIVDALAPGAADTVVEIGPGRGSLTEILAERSGRLIAIEIDRALAEQLREKYRERPHVEIVEADVLDTDLHGVVSQISIERAAGTDRSERKPSGDFLLIGNVPYYITTPILFKALEPPIPKRAVFLVQREVAERIAATEDTEAYGALSVNVAVVARAEQMLSVPRGAFKPPPKVDSVVIRITPLARPLIESQLLPAFRTFVQAAFSLRRKQMQRVLRTIRGISAETAIEILEGAGIDPSGRPEVVSPEGFVRLFRILLEDKTTAP